MKNFLSFMLFFLNILFAYDVTSNADTGAGTLRNGIDTSETTIQMALLAGPFTITLGSDLNLGAPGTTTITQDVDLTDYTTIDGNGNTFNLNNINLTFVDFALTELQTDFSTAGLETLTIDLSRGDNMTYSNSISGGGNLTITGNNTLLLTNNNTYTGTTTISANAALQIKGANASTVIVNNSILPNGLEFTTSETQIYSGVISGTGEVTMSGSGTVTLSDNCLYTGTTTVSAGTLKITGDNASPTIYVTGAGATLEYNVGTKTISQDIDLSETTSDIKFSHTSGTTTFNGSITGGVGTGGRMIISGAGGKTLLGGINLYAAGTTITAGTLGFTGTGTIGPGNVILGEAGAVFDVSSSSNNVTISGLTSAAVGGTVTLGTNNLSITPTDGDAFYGVISGTGGIIIDGLGSTYTIYAEQTFTGGLTINSNTLVLSGNGSLASTGNVVMTLGTLDISNKTTDLTIADLSGTGTVSLGARNLTFGTSSNTTFSGSIEGTGKITKQGTGTVTLSGTNNLTGNSIINEGTLLLTGSISNSDVSVSSNAVLKGTGTVKNLTVNNGGTVRPGASIGTLNVAGNYTQEAGSTLEIEFNNTSTDLIAITGSATINSTATLKFLPEIDSYTSGTTYTLLTATGGINGTFGTETIENSSRLNSLVLTVNYLSNSITFTLSSSSSNNISIIEKNRFMVPLLGDLSKRIIDMQQESYAYQSSLRMFEYSSCFIPVSDRKKIRIAPYANIIHSKAKIRASQNNPAGKYNFIGPIIGLDVLFKKALVGIGANYLYGQINDNASRGKVKSHTAGTCLYGQYTPIKYLSATLLMDFSYSFYDIHHDVTTGGSSSADTEGWHGGAELYINPFYCIKRALFLKGVFKGRYAYNDTYGYTEKKGINNLKVSKDSYNYLETEAGFSLSFVFKTKSESYIIPEITVTNAWQLNDTTRHIDTQLDGTNTNISSLIDGFSNNYIKLESSITASIKKRAYIYLQGMTTFCNRDKDYYYLRLGCSVAF